MNDLFRNRNILLELPHHVELNSVGLLMPSDLPAEDWEHIGHTLSRMDGALQWGFGDWWAFGEHTYGDRTALVESEDWQGPAYQTCVNASNVSKKFESNRRRLVLSFNHHAEVASLPGDTADRLLDWCEEPISTTGKPRSVRALREQVKKSRLLMAQGWTQSQLDRQSRALMGQAVIASMRDNGKGQRVDEALLVWAEFENRLVRIPKLLACYFSLFRNGARSTGCLRSTIAIDRFVLASKRE